MGKKIRKKHTWLKPEYIAIVCCMIVVGTALRLYKLGAHSLWLDEAFTAMFISRDFAFLIDNCVHDRGPLPLMYIFPLIAQTIADNNSEFTLRFFDFVFGSLGIFIIFLVARRIYDHPISALAAVFMISLSSFHQYYSQDARGYTGLVILSMIQLAFLYNALSREHKIYLWWLLYTISVIAALYITLFSIFFIISNTLFIALWLFVLRPESWDTKKRQSVIISYSISTVAILISIGFWLMFSLPYLGKAQALFDKVSPLKCLAFMWSAYNEYMGGNTMVSIGFLALIIAGFIYADKKTRLIISYPLMIFAAAYAVFQFSPLTPGFLHPRYVIMALPFLFLNAGLAITLLYNRVHSKLPIYILGILLLGVYGIVNVNGILHNYATEKQDWRSAGKYIADNYQAGDVIFAGANSCSVVLYYYLPEPIRYQMFPDHPSTNQLLEPMRNMQRAWYATAYYRWMPRWAKLQSAITDPNSWYDTLDAYFDEVIVFPGEYPVQVFLSKTLKRTTP